MSFRFWRRIRIAPGVTLNLSKSGGSLSFGPRGAKFTIGPRGKRATVGIPGTGLFYTTTLAKRKKRPVARRGTRNKSDRHAHPTAIAQTPTVRPEDRLTLGFFKRLVTPRAEEAFVDGCRELVLGHEDKALDHLRKATHLADGAYLAGLLSLQKGRLDDAASYLATAATQHKRLGRYFAKYGMSAHLSLPITDELTAHVGPNLRGVLLGLVEVYQRQRRWRDAIACLERLLRLEPEDVVVKLSLAELLLDAAVDRRHRERDARPHRAALIQGQSPARARTSGRGEGDLDERPAPEKGPVQGTASGAPVRTGPGLRGPRPAPAGAQRVREALRRGPGLRGRGRTAGNQVTETVIEGRKDRCAAHR